MPPDRDTVGRAYLQDIYAEVLNATHDLMEQKVFAETWVRTAIEDERVSDEAVLPHKTNKFGDRAVMWSPDHEANLQATDAGYQVHHPRTMSSEECRKMRDVAGVQSTHDLFGKVGVPAESAELNPVREAFAAWVVELAGHVGRRARVEFIKSPQATVAATCSAKTRTPIVTINISRCPDSWLAQRGPDQLALVIHELAHAYRDTVSARGPGAKPALRWAGGSRRSRDSRQDDEYIETSEKLHEIAAMVCELRRKSARAVVLRSATDGWCHCTAAPG